VSLLLAAGPAPGGSSTGASRRAAVGAGP